MSSGPVVETTYLDAFRERRTVAPHVRAAVLAAMGLDDDGEPPAGAGVAIVRPGESLPVPGEVELEDGTPLGRLTALPQDAPYGYHRVRSEDGAEQLLITGPGRCHLPADLRTWGWTVQLATLRSRASWGIGDLADLRELGRWSASHGAGFLAVSPLGAPNPGPRPEPSPYYPSTRRFGNPLHLRIAEIPGAPHDDELAVAGRALNDDGRVDRERIWRLKLRALEAIWEAVPTDLPAFAAWRAARGPTIERWATFCLLAERHGPGWQSWPEEHRAPDRPGVRGAAEEAPDRVAFHAWIQWCFDRQLASASSEIPRIADLPIGVDPGGFDAWDWQATLALGASVGAPPDRFNAAGQRWGMPPFVPHLLRQARYGPFIDTIQSQLRHSGGLRIDHVLGLFRMWWIPSGDDPAAGAYVRYPTDELLEIVALESHRSGAVVIGEDLGTVPGGVRTELRRRRLLSTRLMIFERVPPARYPRQSFAAVTTHDLPTVAGIVSGADLADQAAAGVTPDPSALAPLRSRLIGAAGIGADASPPDIVEALHARLAAAPPALVAGTLEDALGVAERPNLPGTTHTRRDNWSRALPMPLEDLVTDAGVERLTRALRRTPG
jgi:4-alpha-glucanotransferase